MSMIQSLVPDGLFIDGAIVAAGSSRRFGVIDPSSEKVIAEVADGDEHDALAAVDAASRAGGAWARTPPRERGEVLRRAFSEITRRSEDLARLIVLENGKALPDARAEIAYAAEFFRWYSEEAVRIEGELSIAPSGSNRIAVWHQPIGIALLVTPWNFPAAMLTRKLGPALAAGCTVVVKPAEDTPLTALALSSILSEVGLPKGVLNVVPTSEPARVVDAVLSDARVRKLSFTGSTEVGRMLLAKAASRVLSCSMELGGNAPFIVFADADLDAAVAGALTAKMRNGGEACTSANRFYVEAPVADGFAERLSTALGAMKVGRGLDDGVEVGPLINGSARDKVTGLVEGALAKGANCLLGGKAIEGPGFFYQPTVLVLDSGDAPILKEEIFGPVAPIVTFESEQEAITLANDTEYGLVAYLYTGDLARGLRVAEALEAGMVGLNRGIVSDPAAPFGGMKQSGLGREGGHEGIYEYLETKYVSLSW